MMMMILIITTLLVVHPRGSSLPTYSNYSMHLLQTIIIESHDFSINTINTNNILLMRSCVEF